MFTTTTLDETKSVKTMNYAAVAATTSVVDHF